MKHIAKKIGVESISGHQIGEVGGGGFFLNRRNADLVCDMLVSGPTCDFKSETLQRRFRSTGVGRWLADCYEKDIFNYKSIFDNDP